jgi:TolB-like protein
MEAVAVRPASVVRFGDFEVDLAAGRLNRRGHNIQLRTQSFDVLAMLLERTGQVVTREELRQRLWPGGVVVDYERNLNCAVARLRSALHDPAARPRYIETLPKRGYRFLADVHHDGPAPVPALAVLPFSNLTGDPEMEYLADGFTEALITELGGIRSLRVISRQSILHLKGVSNSLDEIARQLNVETFLEGSVLQQGGRIRIHTQLIRMQPERHVWTRTCDTDLRHSIEAQRELAAAVGEAVGAQLRPRPATQASREVNPEAYEAYLKAAYSCRLLSPDGYQNALLLLESSIRLDPNFAQGYAGLANALAMASFMGQLPPVQGYGQAKPLALRALELDHSLSLAHAALALAEFAYEWNMDAAEAEARRALLINPSEYDARFVLANILLTVRNRPEEAIAEGRVMLSLDPLTPSARMFMAWLHVWSGAYAEAVRLAQDAIEMRADRPMSWNALGMARLGLGHLPEALVAFERAVALARDPVYVAFVGHVKARLGATGEARALLDELLERGRHGYVPPKAFAILYTGLGEVDLALDVLERLYEARDGYLFYVELTPVYQGLRGCERFCRLMRRLRRARQH